jgi:hypothetical protein
MAKVMLRVKADPTKPKTDEDVVIPAGKTKIDQDFDLRDRLSELAIRGNSLSPDDKTAMFGYLTANLGKDKAMKLMNHAYIFNSRPEVQRLTPEEKIKSFYTIGSSDPDIMEVIGKTKNLGYGVMPGFRGSISDLNQAAQGGNVNQRTQPVSPEVTRRIMLKTSR